MKIAEIDKNFAFKKLDVTDVVWHNAREEVFALRGVYYEEAEGRYRRIPAEVAEQVSPGVVGLAVHTAGGHLRFATDSDYVALKVAAPKASIMPHMPATGTFGFALYEDGRYIGTGYPPMELLTSGAPFAFETKLDTRRVVTRDRSRRVREYTLYFPLYSGVNEVFIGLQEGAVLSPCPFPYGDDYLLFYGSSITQGGCASHPGNDYVNMLSHRLGISVCNLGFSGNARAEVPMVEYLCRQDPRVFILDYDHNTPSVPYLETTHERLFLAFRAAHPDTPVVMMSMPDFQYLPHSAERREVIRRTYENAIARGDKNVYFVDGEQFYGEELWDLCSVDCCHPTDLGFYCMAKTVAPILKRILEA